MLILPKNNNYIAYSIDNEGNILKTILERKDNAWVETSTEIFVPEIPLSPEIIKLLICNPITTFPH